jgi:hypothetical protein
MPWERDRATGRRITDETDRGSFQYDVLCGLILIAIFLIPRLAFNDRPDYLRIPGDGEIQRGYDDDGTAVYTVKTDGAAPGREEEAARERLEAFLDAPVPSRVTRSAPVYDTRGRLAAYSFWLRDEPEKKN